MKSVLIMFLACSLLPEFTTETFIHYKLQIAVTIQYINFIVASGHLKKWRILRLLETDLNCLFG